MPAAGRVIEVDADRLTGWVERFAERHGELTTTADRTGLVLAAPDGATAQIAVPYGPLPGAPSVQALAEHVLAPRTIAILLVRRGGWAVGVAAQGRIETADSGGGHVQGSTKAGGWSQQRYARRRGHQAQQVWQRAADGAAHVLLPHRGRLDALVTGGDRPGVTSVLADHRLTWLAPLATGRFLAVPDPTRSVLDDAVARLRAVVITLNERA